jgi:hypothetical protein
VHSSDGDVSKLFTEERWGKTKRICLGFIWKWTLRSGVEIRTAALRLRPPLPVTEFRSWFSRLCYESLSYFNSVSERNTSHLG